MLFIQQRMLAAGFFISGDDDIVPGIQIENGVGISHLLQLFQAAEQISKHAPAPRVHYNGNFCGEAPLLALAQLKKVDQRFGGMLSIQ